MLYLPHKVLVRRPAIVDDESVEQGTVYHAPEFLQAMLTPPKAGTTAFDADGVMLSEPMFLLWDVKAPHAVPVGSVVEHDGHRYVAKTPTATYANHVLAASNHCYLEKMQFDPEGLDILTPAEMPSLIESGGASAVIDSTQGGSGLAMGGGAVVEG